MTFGPRRARVALRTVPRVTQQDDRAPLSVDRPGTIARRALLGTVGVAGLGGLFAAVLGGTGRGAPGGSTAAAPARTPFPTPAVAPSVAAATATPAATPMSHDQTAMTVMQAFPAKTAGRGLQELPSRLVAGVREFDLTCATSSWEVAPGQIVKAFAYNGQVPGPIIRVTEGERVRLRLRNDLAETTSVHCHGVKVLNQMDGVPFITQPPIAAGATYEYEFVATPFGSHMYHSHHNATAQVGAGMLGPLLIAPKDRATDPAYDKDEVFLLNDQMGGFTINGKGFPATTPFTATLGQRIRFRFMNAGQGPHPVHLHGLTYEVFARDGYPLAQPFRCDTITVNPGERWDAIVTADAKGAWAFHCHILGHAEGPTGMFGMVTALVVS